MKGKLHSLRRDYTLSELDHQSIPDQPQALLADWLELALKHSEAEATAMILSTVAGKRPSSRVVLLKELRPEGLVFFSNYKSRKGKELEDNPFASLLFFWPWLERQVRVEGVVRRLEAEESREYFDSRPRESRISAIVSAQSREIELDRRILEEQYAALEAELAGDNPEMPEYWGGYLLDPDRVEFWQGRANRLHDRLLYRMTEGGWQISRLAP